MHLFYETSIKSHVIQADHDTEYIPFQSMTYTSILIFSLGQQQIYASINMLKETSQTWTDHFRIHCRDP